METPDVSTLKTEIAVLEGIIREKKEQLRIAEAIETERRSVAKACCGIAASGIGGR